MHLPWMPPLACHASSLRFSARLPSRTPRYFSTRWRAAFPVLALLLGLPAVGSAEGPRTRVISEGADGLTLRITIPAPQTGEFLLDGVGYLTVEIPGFAPDGDAAPGHPDLPVRGFPFGLPEGVTARIGRVRVLSTDGFSGPPPLPAPLRRMAPGLEIPTQEYRYAPDPEVYQSSRPLPTELVSLAPVMGARHQRIQSVVVRPVQVSPAQGTYEAVRELEVEVRFDVDPGRPSGPRAPARVDEVGWDETMDRLLVNPSSARSFRTRSVPRLPAPQVNPGDVYLRIRVGGTGVCRIPYADLVAAGWPADVGVGDVRVEERGYDKYLQDPFVVTPVPRLVEDGNQDGIFNQGDYLIFAGFNYADRFDPPIADSRYSYFHTYWVTPSAGPGLDVPVVNGFSPDDSLAIPVTSFPFTNLQERNIVYINNPEASDSGIFPIYDAVYWLWSNQKNVNLPLSVEDLAPGADFRVRARWQGVNTSVSTGTHIVSLDLNSQVLLAESSGTTFYNLNPFLWEGVSQPASGWLLEGANTLTVKARTADPANSFTGCLFDWFEVIYDRLLIARGDELRFDSGTSTGLLEFAVGGFSSPEVRILDVTDPTAPFFLTPAVEGGAGNVTARIRVVVGGEPRRFHAFVPTSLPGLPDSAYPLPPDLGTSAISRGLTRDLLVEGQGSDYLLVTHPNLSAAWQPLIDHRVSQGHRVFACDVWEIYDQFAGGDKTPWAIQRFLLHAFRGWDPSPSYLLLGGDACEDYRHDLAGVDVDWVPTLMHFGAVTGPAGLELAGSDTWYAAFLREGDPEWDVAPDMHVARVPAGSTAEVSDFVQKVLNYESMDPGDDWRRRGLFVADDQYSRGILEGGGYCYTPGERVFENTSRAMIDSLRVQAGLLDFRTDSLFLAGHLDTVATLGRNPGATPRDCPPVSNLTLTTSYTQNRLMPALMDSLSRGYLIWEFTGHGNNNQLCHESLVVNYPGGSPQNLNRVNNLEKPFLWMGYACHIMEFEGGIIKDSSEPSLGEVLLLQPNRGAIGVFASSAYEWLTTNPWAQIYTTRPLFWNLPRDPDGRPRRLWGEAMTRGLLALISEFPNSLALAMPRTYQTFGDPALRVDIWPALFANLTVDDVPWAPGTALTAPSFRDTLDVRARVSDDVDVSSIRVLEGGTELPGNLLQIVDPDSAAEGAQNYEVRVRTPLRLGTYDIVLEAVDWTHRPSQIAFPVRFDVLFDLNGVPLHDGDIVEIEDPVGVTVVSPVPLVPENLEIWLDGAVLEGAVPQGGPTQWRIDLVAPWAEGSHILELRVSQADALCLPGPCPLVRGVQFTTPAYGEQLSLSESYFYPNPVEADGGDFLYRLSRAARRGQISIYSVTGRRVLSTEDVEISVRGGLNAFRWDLRDDRGDPVSNGVYLLVLRLEGDEGEVISTASNPERIAVTR